MPPVESGANRPAEHQNSSRQARRDIHGGGGADIEIGKSRAAVRALRRQQAVGAARPGSAQHPGLLGQRRRRGARQGHVDPFAPEQAHPRRSGGAAAAGRPLAALLLARDGRLRLQLRARLPGDGTRPRAGRRTCVSRAGAAGGRRHSVGRAADDAAPAAPSRAAGSPAPRARARPRFHAALPGRASRPLSHPGVAARPAPVSPSPGRGSRCRASRSVPRGRQARVRQAGPCRGAWRAARRKEARRHAPARRSRRPRRPTRDGRSLLCRRDTSALAGGCVRRGRGGADGGGGAAA